MSEYPSTRGDSREPPSNHAPSRERVRLLYASVPAAVLANTVLVLLLAMVQWAVVMPSAALAWVGFSLLTLVVRAGIYAAYRRAKPRDERQWRQWLLRFRAGVIATGTAWGFASLLMFPAGDLPHQVFLAFVIAGVSAGAASSLAVDRVSILGFLVPALLPLILSFALTEGTMHVVMGLMVSLFLVILLLNGTHSRRQFAQNESLRSEAQTREESQQQQARLLRVIAHAQSKFIRVEDRRRAFDGLLADILDLTSSEYGFIGEVRHTTEGAPYLKTYAITNIAWNDETRAFYAANAPQGMEFTNLKTLFGRALTSGEPVIANDPCHDPRRGGLPEGHPALNAFLGIPVHYGGVRVAMLGIANRPGGYDQALIDFLHPLLVTLGQLVEAARAQQKHREGQIELARLSRVASQTTNGVVITDADGRVEWVNEGFTRITGYVLDEMRGRKPGVVLQGEATNPATVAAMRAALARHEAFEVDVANHTKSGQPYWIRINCNPLRDAAGVLQGFMAIESDITAQKQAEENLQETTRLLEGIFENVPSMIFLKDASDLRFRYFNRAGEALVGHAREDLIGRNDYDFFPREQADAFTAKDRAVLAQTGVVDIPEETIETPHGTRILHTQKLALRDAQGRPQYLLGISEDITDKKQALAEVELNESRLRGLFELSPIGIALNDYETGRFVDLNDALLAPTGYTREAFTALGYWDITPREYEPQEALQLESMEKTGRYGPYEKEYIRKDGSRYPVLLNGMVVHDPSGRKLIWSIIEDISERKRMERMKNEFVSTVSHELRTPLTAITGALGLVAGGALGALPEQAGQMVAVAHKNSQRLAHLINDLLDMEKLMAGKLHFDLQARPLMSLIDGAIRDNQAYADQYGVRLDFTERADAVEVEVDSLRLQQVLANLLSNAAKFSPQGGVVEVRASLCGEHVRVAVIDQGPGIPAAFRDRIFQKFSQADASDTRQRGGSGLGLAISRELMERMGGTLGFESVEGEGATFYFELPVCPSRQTMSDITCA